MDIERSLSIFQLTFSPGTCVRSNHFSFLCRQWSPWSFTDGLPLGLAHCCFLDGGVSELASVSIGQSSRKHPRQIGQTGGFQLCKQGRKQKGNHLTGTRTKFKRGSFRRASPAQGWQEGLRRSRGNQQRQSRRWWISKSKSWQRRTLWQREDTLDKRWSCFSTHWCLGDDMKMTYDDIYCDGIIAIHTFNYMMMVRMMLILSVCSHLTFVFSLYLLFVLSPCPSASLYLARFLQESMSEVQLGSKHYEGWCYTILYLVWDYIGGNFQ